MVKYNFKQLSLWQLHAPISSSDHSLISAKFILFLQTYRTSGRTFSSFGRQTFSLNPILTILKMVCSLEVFERNWEEFSVCDTLQKPCCLQTAEWPYFYFYYDMFETRVQ